MRRLRELYKWEVFDDGNGTFYVVINKDSPNYPICDWHALKPSYHHWNEFPEYVRVIGMMFLVPDKD